MNETKIKILSLKGGRKENQDSFGSSETAHGLLIVVCDGMGGAKGGKTASELAVKTIIEKVSNTELTEADQILTEAIKVANNVVYQTGKANPELQGMGTTAVALLIDDEKATAAHVGDSRIYQVRGSRKVFRSFDHSMVFELVRRGTITEEQARLSAESNVILRALGTKPDVEVEINRDLPYLKGDRFLLCSDGICGAVTEAELVKLIICDKSIDKTVETIVKTIDQAGIDSGGKHDNLTAAVIEINTNSKIKPKMDKKSKLIIGIITLLFLISLIINVLLSFKDSKSGAKSDKPMEMVTKSEVDTLQQKITGLNNKLINANKDVEGLKIQILAQQKKHSTDSLQTDKVMKEVIKSLQAIEKSSSEKDKKAITPLIETIKKIKQQ